ncbi:phosphate ABC transporter permease subunit PstC, partial [Nocardioides caeni]
MSATVDPTSTDLTGNSRVGDTIFSRTALLGALLVIAFLAGVGTFLVVQGLPALGAHEEQTWGKSSVWTLVAPLLFGTVLASLVAMVIVTPLAIGL